MLNFKCRNCGGEMSVSRDGELACSYCGSKFVFSDRDLAAYREFRRRMLTYLSAVANHDARPEDTDWLWRSAETTACRTADGSDVEIQHIYRAEEDGVAVYTARRNVIFLFPRGRADDAGRFVDSVNQLTYPSADIKNLSQYFPVITGSFPLEDGRTMLVLAKQEELYPLAAFGSLPPVHAAWIVSRLENLCCALAYSGLAHGGISLESVFINARTHEAYLLGGWWKARPCPDGSREDLTALRATAKRLLGLELRDAPAQFRRFLDDAPAPHAFEDFSRWDQVIEKGFGGRKFEKLDLSQLRV